MKIRNNHNGYSHDLATTYILNDKPVISLSTETEAQYVWNNGHRSNEISGYQAWFVQESVGVFKVKFENRPELPQFLSAVHFKNLEACQVRNNIYFRAKGIEG